MKNKPTVSVVIPLYNKSKQIERCLNSVLRQSYPHFEVIVINDGSSDGSEVVVKAIDDPRIRLIHQVNAGVSVARNMGVEVASNDWIFFLDADDEWCPGMLQQLLELLHRCSAADVVACPTERVYADGTRRCAQLKAIDFEEGTEFLGNYFATFVRLGQSPFSNSSFAVHRRAFIAAGGYKPGVRLTEDSDLWVRLAVTTRIAMITTALAKYYVEVEGNTRTVGQYAKFQVITTLEDALAGGEIVPSLRESAKALVRLQKLTQIRRHVLLGNRGWAIRSLMDVDLYIHETKQALVAVVASLAPSSWVKLGRKLRRRKE